jgi:N-methylhydantoinase B
MRSRRSEREPFFDRGPGYAILSGGAASAEVDWL